MRILTRLLLCILPPILAVVIVGSAIILQVSNGGVNQQERDFLLFKAQQLQNYAANQWNLLVEFRLYYQQDLIRAAQQAIGDYADGLLTERKTTSMARSLSRIIPSLSADGSNEVIFALARDMPRESESALVTFSTEDSLTISREEATVLLNSGLNNDGVVEFAVATIGGTERAYTAFIFDPFNWVVYVSESVTSFRYTQEIIRGLSVMIGVAILVIVTFIIILLSNTITKPLSVMSNSTRDIIRDIPEINVRLPVVYNDEGGILAQSFNSVFLALNRNYQQLRKYTFDNIVIQKREARIKNIFQKYVPQGLIDNYIQRPGSLLESDAKHIAVLFLDIRGFTTISESMDANTVVKMLNGFFEVVVQQITNHNGHIDKYIGDSIMAIFGAPISAGNDALNAVRAAFDILRSIDVMNNSPAFAEFPELRVGIGINYGNAVVGNIGCETKIEYTAIGDTVNLASRIENLCKRYELPLLISGSTVRKLLSSSKDDQDFHIRVVDRVLVTGKAEVTNLYTVLIDNSERNRRVSRISNSAIKRYFNQDFDAAIEQFERAAELDPTDSIVLMFLERAKKIKDAKLPEGWNGAHAFTEKE